MRAHFGVATVFSSPCIRLSLIEITPKKVGFFSSFSKRYFPITSKHNEMNTGEKRNLLPTRQPKENRKKVLKVLGCLEFVDLGLLLESVSKGDGKRGHKLPVCLRAQH